MKLLSFLLFFALSAPCFAVTNATAIFAAGCFWCAQHDFDHVSGVVKTIVGYTGGKLKNPTYQQVSHGGTGHYEAIEVIYNPQQISYNQLLTVFWHNVDPTDASGQFCDKGDQYRSAIFYSNPTQQKLAEESKNKLLASGRFKQIATNIIPATTFYPAEAYHQYYYQKNPIRYKFYRYTCGRDQRLATVWDK